MARIVYRGTTGINSAIVRNDREWSQYIVQFFRDGEYLSKADYFTSCQQDAIDTANHWLNKGAAA
jgi:predicted secreted protein